MSIEIVRVPDIGSDDAVDVIEISVKVGDQLVEEDTIVVLESDKATVEVPLPLAGTVMKLLVKNGDRVKQGDPLLELEVSATGESAESASEQKEEQAAAPSAEKKEQEKAESKAESKEESKEEKVEAKTEEKEKAASKSVPEKQGSVAAAPS